MSDDEVRERMAEATAAVRRLMPYRLCTRKVCVDGCDPVKRARGRDLARRDADAAKRLWQDHGGTVRALEPILDVLTVSCGGDVQLAYCTAVHTAVAGDAFAVPGKDIRAQLARAVEAATERRR